ncbi:MAG: hypothetical protein M1823_001099 [Watsoniomyces obsoletus]|nr:MAG: hypothetical protein M1823_001099 [Watsoniomyces obsoletus]
MSSPNKKPPSGDKRTTRSGAPPPPGQTQENTSSSGTPSPQRRGSTNPPQGGQPFQTTAAVVDGRPVYHGQTPGQPTQPPSTPPAARRRPDFGPIGQLSPTGPRPGQQVKLPHRSPERPQPQTLPAMPSFFPGGPTTGHTFPAALGPASMFAKVAPAPTGLIESALRSTLAANPPLRSVSHAEVERTVQQQIGIDEEMQAEDEVRRTVQAADDAMDWESSGHEDDEMDVDEGEEEEDRETTPTGPQQPIDDDTTPTDLQQSIEELPATELTKALNPQADRTNAVVGRPDESKRRIEARLLHENGDPYFKIYRFKPTVDWNNAGSVLALNRWRQQTWRRLAGATRPSFLDYTPEENQWLIDYFREHRRPAWAKLTKLFNQRFEGQQVESRPGVKLGRRTTESLTTQRGRIPEIAEIRAARGENVKPARGAATGTEHGDPLRPPNKGGRPKKAPTAASQAKSKTTQTKKKAEPKTKAKTRSQTTKTKTKTAQQQPDDDDDDDDDGNEEDDVEEEYDDDDNDDDDDNAPAAAGKRKKGPSNSDGAEDKRRKGNPGNKKGGGGGGGWKGGRSLRGGAGKSPQKIRSKGGKRTVEVKTEIFLDQPNELQKVVGNIDDITAGGVFFPGAPFKRIPSPFSHGAGPVTVVRSKEQLANDIATAKRESSSPRSSEKKLVKRGKILNPTSPKKLAQKDFIKAIKSSAHLEVDVDSVPAKPAKSLANFRPSDFYDDKDDDSVPVKPAKSLAKFRPSDFYDDKDDDSVPVKPAKSPAKLRPSKSTSPTKAKAGKVKEEKSDFYADGDDDSVPVKKTKSRKVKEEELNFNDDERDDDSVPVKKTKSRKVKAEEESYDDADEGDNEKEQFVEIVTKISRKKARSNKRKADAVEATTASGNTHPAAPAGDKKVKPTPKKKVKIDEDPEFIVEKNDDDDVVGDTPIESPVFNKSPQGKKTGTTTKAKAATTTTTTTEPKEIVKTKTAAEPKETKKPKVTKKPKAAKKAKTLKPKGEAKAKVTKRKATPKKKAPAPAALPTDGTRRVTRAMTRAAAAEGK